MSGLMREARIRANLLAIVCGTLAVGGACRAQELEFIPSTAAHGYAVRAYQAIWDEFGARILTALERRTCLAFAEPKVSAVIADAVSHSGGPEHPMRLRASYTPDVKRSTLVHELGHRHLWQLEERIDGIDGHMTLYLVLDLVWQDVWGQEFAAQRIEDESLWRANYDYEGAWHWARSLDAGERTNLWQELLRLNGFADRCISRTDKLTRLPR